MLTMHLVKTNTPFFTSVWNDPVMWELATIAIMLKRTRS